MKKTFKAAAVIAALSVAACSGESDEKKEADGGSNTAAQSETQSETQTPEQKASDTMSEREAFRAENLEYLEANKAKEGVIVTESGLQYRVIESGEGKSPSAADYVTVHYAGRLIDGSEFDSSYKRGEPATFPAGRLIPGWTEALQLMKEGDKWELAIPADIGYGDSGAGGVIPGNATLVFDVELIEVLTMEQVQQKAEEMAMKHKTEQLAFLEENAKKDGITVLESGLQYRVIEEGTGASPEETSMVTVHYAGTMIDGTEFDSSYKRGEPAQFPLDGVIKGWTEGVQLMKEGAKYEFFIPYDLAYGERGSRSIPPFSTLIFTVELVSVDS
ncbi:MAG: FKBP-type peptidyl-prolyl cis-trans isomerase [Alphaproteobacteria bacterium]|nr:FKBP-type peptidyl-prolyl cis-trans isomerase [Alphaproteobacteria bacterium]